MSVVTRTRLTKQKRALMSLGYSLEQLNEMSPAQRHNLLVGSDLKDRIAEFKAPTIQPVQNSEPQIKVEEKTEEEIKDEIKKSFEALDDLTLATVMGANRSLIISGKAGVGKSFGVNLIVKEYSDNPVFVTGYARATGLYRTLYENRTEGSTIVLDDIDCIFSDEQCLNVLKHACDSSDKRMIHWLTESNMKDEDGEFLPKSYEFEGNIIFITNKDLPEIANSGSKIAPHIEAMISRSLYVDVGMRHPREAITRIKQVINEFDMLKNLNDTQKQQLIEWIEENQHRLRDLSLRTAKKLSTLMETSTDKWKQLAEKALCK